MYEDTKPEDEEEDEHNDEWESASDDSEEYD
jgi:hypothetical protein